MRKGRGEKRERKGWKRVWTRVEKGEWKRVRKY